MRPTPRSSATRARRLPRTLAMALTWAVVLLLTVAPLALAQDDATYDRRQDGIHISDAARVFDEVNECFQIIDIFVEITRAKYLLAIY